MPREESDMSSGTAATAAANTPVSKGDSADRILELVQKLQGQITEARETTRKEVTQILLNKFSFEIAKVQAECDRRIQDVQQKIWDEARGAYEPKLSDAEKLIGQLKQDAATYANEWRADRQKLQEQIGTLERNLDVAMAVRTEEEDAYKDLERKLQEAAQSKEQLQLDLQKAVAELNSRAQSEIQDVPDHPVHREVAAIVQAEMVRVRMHIDEIDTKLANPDTDLGSEIRLNRERTELQAYLKGLRYSLGEVTLQTSTLEDSCHV
jgi:hypothetical protein